MSAPLGRAKRQYFIARNPDVTPAQIALAKAAPYDRLETAMQDMGGGVVFIASGEIVSFHERHAWLLERRGSDRMSAIVDVDEQAAAEREADAAWPKLYQRPANADQRRANLVSAALRQGFVEGWMKRANGRGES